MSQESLSGSGRSTRSNHRIGGRFNVPSVQQTIQTEEIVLISKVNLDHVVKLTD